MDLFLRDFLIGPSLRVHVHSGLCTAKEVFRDDSACIQRDESFMQRDAIFINAFLHLINESLGRVL